MNLPNREFPGAHRKNLFGTASRKQLLSMFREWPKVALSFDLGLDSRDNIIIDLEDSDGNPSTPFVPKSTHRTLRCNNPSSLWIRCHHLELRFDDLGLVVVALVELSPINQGLEVESSQEEEMEGRYRWVCCRVRVGFWGWVSLRRVRVGFIYLFLFIFFFRRRRRRGILGF